MDATQNLITIIIPTYKRPHLLKRILNHYINWKGRILVADSSPNKFSEIHKYNCEYYHYPNASAPIKLAKIVQKVKTPYVQFNADDDFCEKNGIIQCVEFLENNPQYSTAEGNYIFFDESKLISSPYQILPIFDYNQNNLKERLNKALCCKNNVNCFYSVHRSKNILDVFDYLDKYGYFNYLKKTHPILSIVTEYTLQFFAHIRGFHKRLPFFHIARSNTPTIEQENLRAWCDVIGEEYEIFKKVISKYIITHHKVTLQYAEEAFTSVFDFWINYFKNEDKKNNSQFSLTRIFKWLSRKLKFDDNSKGDFIYSISDIKNNNIGYPNKIDLKAQASWEEMKEIIKKSTVK